MFKRWQQKWKVSGTQLVLILCVFAITGTTTAYISREITAWFQIPSSSFWYWMIKLMVLLFGYQIIILLVAIPFGQFHFFWNYEKKILRRFGLIAKEKQFEVNKCRIAIFASGTGSNAQQLINYFNKSGSIKTASVELIVCNNVNAGVLNLAKNENIPSLLINKNQFFSEQSYIDELKNHQINFIVLAGFLWKIPVSIIKNYPNKIVNIHPALLPKYGGKGMYGHYVHEAVLKNNEPESGISIHYVDEFYDHGKTIFQAKCTIAQNETTESLAQKIHHLEHAHYSKVVEAEIKKQKLG